MGKKKGKNKQKKQQGGNQNGSNSMQICGGSQNQLPSAVKKNLNAQKKEQKKKNKKDLKKQAKNNQCGGNKNKNKSNVPGFALKTSGERAVFVAPDDRGIERHWAVNAGNDAHDADISEILCDGTNVVYTLSRDKKIIHWLLEEKEPTLIADHLNLFGAPPASDNTATNSLFGGFNPTSTSSSSSASSSNVKKFHLKKQNAIEMPYPVWSALFSVGCLFVGLGNGTVKVFSKNSGDQFEFEAHTKRVSCIRRHEQTGIVITTDHGGALKCWKLQPQPDGKVQADCVFETELNAEVKTFHILQGCWLYIATAKGLFRLPLAQLETAKPEKLNSEGLNTLSPWNNEQYVICTTRAGEVQIFEVATGAKKHTVEAVGNMKNILTLDEVAGERVVCGHQDGKLSSFAVPNWQRQSGWRIIDKLQQSPVANVTCVRKIPSAPGVFVVGLQTGALQVWKYASAATNNAAAVQQAGMGAVVQQQQVQIPAQPVVVGAVQPVAPQQVAPQAPVPAIPNVGLVPTQQQQQLLQQQLQQAAQVPLPDDDDDDL
ncbi:unnamed protein product [Amoebophrya sp. A120]|nr:unnamed protein product [Amoebophrya sp. A120]|eukprot:GSA120T00005513001.1